MYGSKGGRNPPMMGMMKKLTAQQKTDLMKHSVKHSKKHMASMRMSMMRGMSFAAAHKKAMMKGK